MCIKPNILLNRGQSRMEVNFYIGKLYTNKMRNTFICHATSINTPFPKNGTFQTKVINVAIKLTSLCFCFLLQYDLVQK